MNHFFPQWHGLAYGAHPISQGFQQLSTKEESSTQGISERSRTPLGSSLTEWVLEPVVTMVGEVTDF